MFYLHTPLLYFSGSTQSNTHSLFLTINGFLHTIGGCIIDCIPLIIKNPITHMKKKTNKYIKLPIINKLETPLTAPPLLECSLLKLHGIQLFIFNI